MTVDLSPSYDCLPLLAFLAVKGVPLFLKSDAIVVGRRPFMNTSLVLRCYTRRAGLFAVIAKGAFRRPRKAEPASVPDLLQRGETVLYLSPRRESAILREWTLDDMRPGLRNDYDAFRAGTGCAAVVEALSWHGERTGELFDLLDGTLTELDAGAPPRQALWAFVLQAFARAGFLAPLDSCAACGCVLKGGGNEAAGLSGAAGGFVCGECAGTGDEREGVLDRGAFGALGREAAAAARFLSGSAPGAVRRLKVSPRAAASLERATRSLAEYTLERPMPALAP